MPGEQEQQFAEIAREKGLLAEAQIKECRDFVKLATQTGVKITLTKVVQDRGLLSPEQIKTVHREMRRRGVLPRIAGYELISKLGQGGMGAVYKARQVSLDRPVALKVLPPELARDRQYTARFRREARLAAKVVHPNAVQVFDVGEDTGRHFIAMEFIAGSDVTKLMQGGPVEEGRALAIVIGVAKALAVAHAQGIVHRDIKPANIMLTSAGTPKLSDLGIAKQIGAVGATLTQTGAAIGTPQYMSPEQCKGEKTIDVRSDTYSLGATLYHMVCGKAPFNAATAPAVMHKQVYDPLPDPLSVNPRLSKAAAGVICKMMSKDRDRRYRDDAELIADLESCAAGRQPEADYAETVTSVGALTPTKTLTGQSAPPPTLPPAESSKGLWVAAAVFVVLIVGGLTWALSGRNPDTERPVPARPDASYQKFMNMGSEAEIKRDWSAAIKAYEAALANKQAPEAKGKLAAAQHGLYLSKAERETDLDMRIQLLTQAQRYLAVPATAKLLIQAQAEKAKRRQLARNKAERDTALALGKRLLSDKKWKEAAAAYGGVLKIPGYENDSEAKVGIARSIGEQEAQGRRVAYQAALDEANTLHQRARGTRDQRLWKEVKAAAERALKTGHADASAAKKLLADAEAHLGPPIAAGFRRAGWTAQEKRVKVATPQGDKEKDVAYYTNSIGMKFVLVPAGEFMMGSEKGDSDEKPAHRVRIPKAFYMGAHEVTNAQWRAFNLENLDYDPKTESRGEGGQYLNKTGWNGPDQPMVYVSWRNARRFCEWLTRKEGLTYRLATEAEWEYACGAGSGTVYYWGDNAREIRGDCLWHGKNSRGRTNPVGWKLPNAFGLYDMSGNVWEWCQDWYKGDYYGMSPSIDPKGPPSGRSRVLRGGGYGTYGGTPRSANRFRGSEEGVHYMCGFRIVALPQGAN